MSMAWQLEGILYSSISVCKVVLWSRGDQEISGTEGNQVCGIIKLSHKCSGHLAACA